MGIPVVMAAGNTGPEDTLDNFVPQAFAPDEQFPMITVGGVDKEGRYWINTVNSKGEGGKIDLYAGSVDVTLASSDGDDKTVVDSGTSLAAPAVVR
jgi:hypothetical protein